MMDKLVLLYNKLKEAYSDKNLNKITAKIIELYKLKFYNEIRQICKLVADFINIDSKNTSKCFTTLVMVYHPDKGNYYRNEIEKIYRNGNYEELNQFSHILLVQDIENVFELAGIDEDCDFIPEYEWEYETDGFRYFSDTETDLIEQEQEEYEPLVSASDNSFYNAVKRKIYGNSNMEMPSYYLEDFDEIDMAEYEINNLDGISYCIHATNINLSRNQINDISELSGLKQLEELYLSENNISIIDALYSLKKLRIVDISYNNIDDLTPIINLDNLEYVNIVGNQVPEDQVETLKANGAILVY